MENKYIDDLKEIKDMMNRSTRFSALSGLSGISVGIIGILAAFLAYWFVLREYNKVAILGAHLQSNEIITLLLIAAGALVTSLSLIFFLTSGEIKKLQQQPWDQNTRRILINLAIPLLTGGVIGIIFLLRGFVSVTIALTLVFYGLALVNASKYTLSEIRSLGILEIIIGLLALQFVSYGLLFWAVGFGLLHIIYGIIIQAKLKA